MGSEQNRHHPCVGIEEFDYVPDHLRPGVAEVLRKLVAGELPEQLTWVHRYGGRGATLINQPEELWTHGETDAARLDDGGWHIVVPLWTTDECPSDLSAEIRVDPEGNIVLYDVHVL